MLSLAEERSMVAFVSSEKELKRMVKLFLYRGRVPDQVDMMTLMGTKNGRVDVCFSEHTINLYHANAGDAGDAGDAITTRLDASTSEEELYKMLVGLYENDPEQKQA